MDMDMYESRLSYTCRSHNFRCITIIAILHCLSLALDPNSMENLKIDAKNCNEFWGIFLSFGSYCVVLDMVLVRIAIILNFYDRYRFLKATWMHISLVIRTMYAHRWRTEGTFWAIYGSNCRCKILTINIQIDIYGYLMHKWSLYGEIFLTKQKIFLKKFLISRVKKEKLKNFIFEVVMKNSGVEKRKEKEWN
jgi:hypothetical protein